MRAVVLGAAGFLGSHLCDALISRGDEVVAVDDLSSGSIRNLVHLDNNRQFSFSQCDISEGISVDGSVDVVLNFASPASPPRYAAMPVHTLRTGSRGTEAALNLAHAKDARMLMASTSEVYGDPQVSPQPESYWGNVNPVGERSCYDEAKRFAEALCVAHNKEFGTDVGIVRIFNTYGPRLDPGDGRVVSNFIWQAIHGHDITIYGDGSQTRSFCYVDDQVRGIIAMLESSERGPINIGNPSEFTVIELAEMVLRLTGSRSRLTTSPLPQDDPMQRCPDITLATSQLGWRPLVDLESGLYKSIDWFRERAEVK